MLRNKERRRKGVRRDVLRSKERRKGVRIIVSQSTKQFSLLLFSLLLYSFFPYSFTPPLLLLLLQQ